MKAGRHVAVHERCRIAEHLAPLNALGQRRVEGVDPLLRSRLPFRHRCFLFGGHYFARFRAPSRKTGSKPVAQYSTASLIGCDVSSPVLSDFPPPLGRNSSHPIQTCPRFSAKARTE